MNAGRLPTGPGVYILHLSLLKRHRLKVGCLGFFDLSPGEYLYSGSACGPGGLHARLGRHLRGDGRPHWHIDALRQVTNVAGYGYILGSALETLRLECLWAHELVQFPGATFPILGFGSSDCRLGCRAHLVALPPGSEIPTILTNLGLSYFGI